MNFVIKAHRKPSEMSLEEKYRLIKAIDDRGDRKKAEIADQFNISLSSVWYIYKEKNKWINQFNNKDKELSDECDDSTACVAVPNEEHSDDERIISETNISSAKKAKKSCDWFGCDYLTESITKLKHHQNKHLGVRPYKCAYNGCDKSFHSKYSLHNHKAFVHEFAKTIACSWPNCASKFKTNAEFNKHMKTHSVPHHQRPFACDWPDCTFRALNKYNLTAHKFVHNDKRLFSCNYEECGKSFKLESTLKIHQLTHSNELHFKCDWPDCNVAYRCWQSLNRHKLRHQNIDTKVFTCDWPGCDYKSDRQEVIRRHKTVHTNERNFACSWPQCDKRLKSQKNLREHMRIHMNDKRYSCQWPGCEYRCVQVGSLKQHFNVHVKKK